MNNSLRFFVACGVGAAIFSINGYINNPAPKVAATPAVTQVTLPYDEFGGEYANSFCKFLANGDEPTRAAVNARYDNPKLYDQLRTQVAANKQQFDIDLEVAIWDTCSDVIEQVSVQ